MSNLKQIGLGILQYTQDYDEKMPQIFGPNSTDKTYAGADDVWRGYSTVIMPYVKSRQVFGCPSDTGAGGNGTPFIQRADIAPTSYFFSAYNGYLPSIPGIAGRSLAAIDPVSGTAMVSEYAAAFGESWHQRQGAVGPYPDARDNVCFVDGHVKFIKIDYVPGAYPSQGDLPFSYNPPANSGYLYVWGTIG